MASVVVDFSVFFLGGFFLGRPHFFFLPAVPEVDGVTLRVVSLDLAGPSTSPTFSAFSCVLAVASAGGVVLAESVTFFTSMGSKQHGVATAGCRPNALRGRAGMVVVVTVVVRTVTVSLWAGVLSVAYVDV